MKISEIKNKQQSIAKTLNVLTIIGSVLTALPFVEGHFLSGFWA